MVINMQGIKVAEIFSSHMVLQRNKRFSVFGEGEEGIRVTVKICNQAVTGIVKEGKWLVEFSPINRKEAVSMEIMYEEDENVVKTILEDIVFGEVFLAGGQSNMAYELCKTMEYANGLEEKEEVQMRYFHTPRRAYMEEDKSNEVHGWHLCTEENKKLFSAVSYFFAKELLKEIDCVVGIIGCNWGGTSLLSWVNEEAGNRIPQLDIYLANVKKMLDDKNEEQYQLEEKAYEDALQAFTEETAQYAYLEDNLLEHYHITKQITYPWPPPLGKRSFLRPFGLYKSMTQPMSPFAMRGVLWYQGESDALEHSEYYQEMLKELIYLWRKSFQDEELPFFIVQLPLFDTSYDTGGSQVKIREAQYLASIENLHTYTVCTIDTGEKDNIHPFYKREIGVRLANMAAYHCYKKGQNPYGPIFQSIQRKEDGWILSFTNVTNGLYAKYGVVLGFEVEENDDVYSVEGKIVGSTIHISMEQVKNRDKVTAIRYGWQGFIIATLYNGVGLPMYPFRVEE